MNDKEWSLRDKEKDLIAYGRKLNTIYFKDDIETLREKSIEDFKEFVDYIVEHPADIADASRKHIEKMNRRFGVNTKDKEGE